MPGRRNGADDEGTGSDSEDSSREAEVVGSCRDYGSDGSYDAALARTAERTRLQRIMGLPQAQSQPEASSDEDPELERQEIAQMLARSLDVLLIASAPRGVETFRALNEQRKLYVLIDRID